jgi:hypothetical protein
VQLLVVLVRPYLVGTSHNFKMFRKFKLVPIDGSEQQQQTDIKQLEKELRGYNPTVRAMTNLYGGMQDALFSKKKKRRGGGLSTEQRLHLAAANRLRMQQLLHGHERVKDTLLQAPQPQPLQSEPKLQPELDQLNIEKGDTDAGGGYEEDRQTGVSNLAIPTRHSAKFSKLMEAASDTVGTNQSGELVIRGKRLKNTSYSDVMRALYVDSNFTVPGLNEIVSELKVLGVEPSLFTSRRARVLYSAAPSSATNKKLRQQKGSGKCFVAKRMLRLY